MNIKIGALRYNIKYVKDLHDGDVDLNGHIVYNKQSIAVDSGMTKDVTAITFLHEIIHGVIDHAGGMHE